MIARRRKYKPMVNRDGYYKAITDAELRELGHLPALEKATTIAPEVYDMSMEDREDIPGYDIDKENNYFDYL